jgi:hypothetical protein
MGPPKSRGSRPGRARLNTPYVHVIFTLPHDLGPLALQNPRLLYGLLFRTVAQTLQDIAGDPKHLGAEIGGFAVLHTWGQQLHHHPHLHCVLPAGGLAPDGTQGIPCRPHFFLPIRVLSRRFRRLYLAGLEQLYAQGHLTLMGRCRELAEIQPWHQFLAALRDKEWVVYAKEPIQDSQHVLTYLARYTHRTAISNHRLMALEGDQVTFRYKDYRRGHRLRTLTLEAVEFLRRLMLHVPAGIVPWLALRHVVGVRDNSPYTRQAGHTATNGAERRQGSHGLLSRTIVSSRRYSHYSLRHA